MGQQVQRGRKNGVQAVRRLAGACGAAGAFLAFGMTPLAAPPAKADFGLDDLFDVIDPSLVGAAGSAAAVPAADASTLADAFQQDFWVPLHTALEDWINSPTGEDVDNDVINPLFSPVTKLLDEVFAPGTAGFCGIICDGTPGTATDPNGGDGGLWFGNGGAGYSYDDTMQADVGLVGGNGGAAGGWGDGGDGGSGGYAAAGGLGGAGGEGYGNGGTGGDGGNGGYVSGISALMGAGNGGAGGPTGNHQDWLGYFADGNGGDGGLGGISYDSYGEEVYPYDGGNGGAGGDGSAFVGTGGTGGMGGAAIPGTDGGSGSGPTGEIGGAGGPGGTPDNDDDGGTTFE